VLYNQATLEKESALKMIWSSALWLVCAVQGCTVGGVHQEHEPMLRGLVNELYREYEELLDGYADIEAVMEHLKAYSGSIPHAVPSKVLALDEFSERNGWFLRTSLAAGRQQPLHERMLNQCGIHPNNLDLAAEAIGEKSNDRKIWISHPACGARFLAKLNLASLPVAKSAIVIGSGIMGSAVALELCRSGVKVTVLDKRPDPLSGAGDQVSPIGHTLCIDASSGSWAWINANNKDKMSTKYGELSRLGMSLWRQVPPYSSLANWCGSIVASKSSEGSGAWGAYAVKKNLTPTEAKTLEPLLAVEFNSAVSLHSYPDEGHSSPRELVASLRESAAAQGAAFKWGTQVDALLYNQNQQEDDIAPRRSNGVLARQGGETLELHADVVVLAAGVGIGSKALGNSIPMLHSPGSIAHSAPVASGVTMQSMFIDSTSGVHVLQRPDGRCAIGGDMSGYGVVTDAEAKNQREAPAAGEAFVRRAAEWLPALSSLSVQGVTTAGRVVPQDGFPAVGWSVVSGAYVVATHSGVTLSPVIAALAAAELSGGIEMDLLKGWRPSRFPISETYAS
jgi:glycine/D-amino acid oxidase-like deaminating enzyme